MIPEITIITPVYNGENYIAEVIESIVLQEEVVLEHIIINDGSTDRTLEIVKTFQQRYPSIIKIIDQENSGEAAAVNRGLLEANAEYIGIVNADDPLLSKHCRTMIDALNSSNAVVAYPDWIMIDQNNCVLRKVETLDYSRRALIADFVCLPGPGAVMRVGAIEGFVLRDIGYRYISDFVCWLQFSQKGNFVRVAEYLATWRQHSEGATAMGSGVPISNELIRLAEQGLEQIFDKPMPKNWNKSARAHAYYYASLNSLSDRKAKGLRNLIRSFILKPLPSWGYSTHHRSVLAAVAVLLGPIGRQIIKLRNSARGKQERLDVTNKTANEIHLVPRDLT